MPATQKDPLQPLWKGPSQALLTSLLLPGSREGTLDPGDTPKENTHPGMRPHTNW